MIPTVSPELASGWVIGLPLESVPTTTSSAFTLNITLASESIASSGIWPKSL